MIKKFLLIILYIIFQAQSASGNIQIFPTSVVLVNENNKGSLTVRNTGLSNVEYKISAVYYEMDNEGRMKELEKNDALNSLNSGAKYIKFSPKKITLGPKEEQVFRFILDIPKADSKKNVRLHLKFTPVSTLEATNQKSEKISFALDAKLALAINITYFGNPSELLAEISDLEFKKKLNKESAHFKFKLKTANDFIVGMLQVIELQEDNTEEVKKTILGFSSYIKERNVQIELLENERCAKNKKCLIRFTPNELLSLPSVESTPKK